VGLEERGTAELERVRGDFLQLRQRLFRLVVTPCPRNAAALVAANETSEKIR
jgi:hypothetical protein